MPYKRYYKRPFINKDKYSVETTAGTIETGEDGNANVIVVPSASLQGMRKVKHITVSLAGPAGQAAGRLYWGLVYVPEGYNPNTLNISGTGFYEPNQFLMCAGVADFDAGPCRITSPISRNLNGGDRIMLIVKGATQAQEYQYVIRYAITLQ